MSSLDITLKNHLQKTLLDMESALLEIRNNILPNSHIVVMDRRLYSGQSLHKTRTLSSDLSTGSNPSW